MISALAVCNNILKRAFQQKIDVTPMKLQKLLYFIHKDYLKATGIPLFAEPFLAWKHGPVLQTLYDKFKVFGAKPIAKFAKDASNNVLLIDEKRSPRLGFIIERVWEQNKHFNGIDLAYRTHQKDTAWDKAIKAKRKMLLDADIANEP